MGSYVLGALFDVRSFTDPVCIVAMSITIFTSLLYF